MHRVLIGALEELTDLCGDTNRAKIIRRNQADDVIDVCGLPRPVERRQRCLRRKTLSPPFAVEYPTEINTRPSLRVVQTHTADDVSARLFDDGPLTVTLLIPVAEHPPHVLYADLYSAWWRCQGHLLLLEHLRILMNDHKWSGVSFLRQAEQQTRGLDRDHTQT